MLPDFIEYHCFCRNSPDFLENIERSNYTTITTIIIQIQSTEQRFFLCEVNVLFLIHLYYFIVLYLLLLLFELILLPQSTNWFNIKLLLVVT